LSRENSTAVIHSFTEADKTKKEYEVERLFDKQCQNCLSTATLFHLRVSVPREVIKGLYCPICRDMISFNAETMSQTDDGWIIEHVMNIDRNNSSEPGHQVEGSFKIASFILDPGNQGARYRLN
jgi:hypothetical protein